MTRIRQRQQFFCFRCGHDCATIDLYHAILTARRSEWLTITTLQKMCSHWRTFRIHPNLTVTTKSTTNSTSTTTILLLNACQWQWEIPLTIHFKHATTIQAVKKETQWVSRDHIWKIIHIWNLLFSFQQNVWACSWMGSEITTRKPFMSFPINSWEENHAPLRFLSFHSVQPSTKSCTNHWSPPSCGYASFTSPR